MRLVDVDKIGLTDFEIVMCEGSYKNALVMLIDKITNAPTVDAVPVVRCKECKHPDAYNHCTRLSIWNKPEDFCSYAERKEECVNM